MDFKRMLDQINSVFNNMTMSQKATMLMFFFVVVTSLVMLSVFSGRSTMRPIADTSDPRASEIQSKLDELNVDYELQKGKLVVDSEKWDLVQMKLAEHSLLPENMEFDWTDVLNDTSLTTTRRLRDMKYKKALENSLRNVLRKMNNVRDASVNITLQDDEVFLKDYPDVKASIMLTLSRTGRMSDENVQAVIDLVSYGVKGLKPENVSITDTRGTQYKSEDPGTVSGRAGARLKIKTHVEKMLGEKARAVLSNLGHVIAVATVEIDMDIVSKQTKDIDQQGTGAIAMKTTSEQEKDKNTQRDGGNVATTPNTRGNVEGAGAGTESEHSRKYNDTTYDVDHIIENIEKTPGVITKRSIAITIPYKELPLTDKQREAGEEPTLEPIKQEIIDQYTKHIQAALGMNAKTDQISIISQPIKTAKQEEPSMVSHILEGVRENARSGLLLFAVAAIIIFMRSMMHKASEQMQSERDREFDFLETKQETLDEPEVLSGQARLLQEKVTEMIHDNPQRAARLVSKWVKE